MTDGTQHAQDSSRTQAAVQTGGVRARKGFTLLEVLLVIALIAVTGSLFLVSFESIGRTSPLEEFEESFGAESAAPEPAPEDLSAPAEPAPLAAGEPSE